MRQKTKTKISKSLINYHKRKIAIADSKAVAGLAIIVATVGILVQLWSPIALADDTARHTFLPTNKNKENLTVQDKIIKAAQGNNINVNKALAISWCESRHNPLIKNSISSATGLWQFTKGTFLDGIRWRGLDWNLDDRFNVDKSTDMAMWFVGREGWGRWECAKILGYTN